jgi:hypothetical protein
MKAFLTSLCVAVLTVSAIEASASDRDAIEVEGSYILYLQNDRQRLLSFDRGGNVIDVSDLEAVYGFTTGVGAWHQTGPDSATARVIDFNFDVDSGEPTGPALIMYDLTFGDLVQGKYQTVTGSLSGRQYEPGQDPLAPTKEPTRTFENTFAGKRITSE